MGLKRYLCALFAGAAGLLASSCSSISQPNAGAAPSGHHGNDMYGLGVPQSDIDAAAENAAHGTPLHPSNSLAGKVLVIVDPGHGMILDNGPELGCHLNGHMEYRMVNPIAAQFGKNMHQQGNAVAFTRRTDGQLFDLEARFHRKFTWGQSLKLRTDFACALVTQTGASYAFFIASHINECSENLDAHGSIAFSYTPQSTELRDYIAQACPLNGKPAQRKREGFLVLTSQLPSVLYEAGFITNKPDLAEMLRDPGSIADQMSRGALNYIHHRNSGGGVQYALR